MPGARRRTPAERVRAANPLRGQPCSWSLQRIASNSSGQPGGQHASCTGPELRHQREQCEVTAAATPNISVAFCFPACPSASTRTLKTVTDPLPSWRDGRAKQAIVGFVRRVRGEDGSESVPAEERVAVFDNDGTLWCEKPIQAWTDSGGTVVGLAPSAAAAAQLRDATGAPAETLAKLTWSIHHTDLPDWAERIGRSTLVIIDEAGMAGTLSLDTAVQFINGRGGSVRLVGDDQQLAAIGAGGVLRDIQASHGALRLTELHRFADTAEAAATLALRDGRAEALGFYLDRRRVHVGDPASSIDSVFNAWQADRSRDLDAIMLAPTRELVRSLNQRAQDHRLAGSAPGREVELADGNAASIGDLIITRRNDRRLHITATDWVKNGDRWTILKLTRTGGLTVRHTRNGRTVTLPAAYVQTSVELGCTQPPCTPHKVSPLTHAWRRHR